MCVHCTVHNCCTQYCTDRPDNFPSWPPAHHHCSDDVYLREGEQTADVLPLSHRDRRADGHITYLSFQQSQLSIRGRRLIRHLTQFRLKSFSVHLQTGKLLRLLLQRFVLLTETIPQQLQLHKPPALVTSQPLWKPTQLSEIFTLGSLGDKYWCKCSIFSKTVQWVWIQYWRHRAGINATMPIPSRIWTWTKKGYLASE